MNEHEIRERNLMSVRKKSATLGLAAAAACGLALTAMAPATADTKPGATGVAGTYALGTTVVGVGSDTIQWVDDQLSKDYDNQATTPSPAWANFDACLGNTTVGAPGLGDNPDGSGFPCGADHSGTQAGVKRDEGVVDAAAAGHPLPSGSGDGRTLLRTPADPLFADVAYGRSSGPINTTDLAAGEIALPFAVDKIVVATQPGGPAPASLTGQQILKIYNGTFTNWNEVGGKNAPIHPYMPKAGSSTLNAFESFLAALDNTNEAPGSDNDPASHAAASQTWQGPSNTITNDNWNTGSANVEEHDPSVIIADKNSVEPFSYARAQLANGASATVRIEGGWSEDRELYHVVRGAAISGAATTPFLYGSDSNVLENLFSSTGWVCTNATAQTDIAQAGFWPLKSGTATGNCGVKNTNTEDTINAFGSNGLGEGNATTLSAHYAGGAVHVTVEAVKKNGSDTPATPTGKVQVVAATPGTPGNAPAASFHATATLGADGTATVKVPGSVSGQQTFDVAYLPTHFGANGADGHAAYGSSYAEFNAKVSGKIATSVKATAKPKTLANAGAKAKVTVTVKAASGSAKPTGTVKITLGKKTVAKGSLKKGSVTLTVKGSALKKGKNKLTVSYLPKGGFKAPGKTTSVTITRKK
jgi:ABC-type phosphate transport system substrate-binding protein